MNYCGWQLLKSRSEPRVHPSLISESDHVITETAQQTVQSCVILLRRLGLPSHLKDQENEKSRGQADTRKQPDLEPAKPQSNCVVEIDLSHPFCLDDFLCGSCKTAPGREAGQQRELKSTYTRRKFVSQAASGAINSGSCSRRTPNFF